MTNKADETTYLWENIPRELWNDARAKAMRERRPMKEVLKGLLENWVGGGVAPVGDAAPIAAEVADAP